MSNLRSVLHALIAATTFLSFSQLYAQDAPSYGTQVTLDQAKKIAGGALNEARKNKWNVAVAVVDNSGALVYYERMDDTQTASPAIAVEKARTAAMYRRPTRVFEETINKGRVSALGLSDMMPVSGGLPIVIGGKIAGAIGASGVTADQDEQIARAGLEGLK